MPEIASSAPTADERERLREQIRAEIARRRPRGVALRTLQLLAEAASEPVADAPNYRIIDRTGAPRLRQPDSGPPVAMTLADLVDEIEGRHPALFLPPEPPPAPAPEPAATESLREPRKGLGKGFGKGLGRGFGQGLGWGGGRQDGQATAPPPAAPAEPAPEGGPAPASTGDEVRAATARFVETQSVLAKSLAADSAARGRAFAATAAGGVASLRERLRGARDAMRPAPAGPGAAEAAPRPGLGGTLRETGQLWAGGLSGLVERLRERASPETSDQLRRRWLVGAVAAAVLAVGAAALVTAGREPSGVTSESGTPPAAPPASGGAPATPPAAETEARTPAEGSAAPAAAPPAANPNEIAGPVEVIDTATLRIGGRLVHLFGVEWVRGGQAEELTRYLAGRTVACQPVTGSQNVLCQVDGRDLSEVVLFNGGGRASPEATPDLVAAEDHARSERLGVWKR
ncbi:thermonuclease family protein [Methylobacterium planeticum]|uniref:thermonuclease family protein n=1 Tax=Methylobacterium planeticum TaxID=2615211 RepID=UPI001FEECB70|nr:nuclease [Methylobacterium planeticum]